MTFGHDAGRPSLDLVATLAGRRGERLPDPASLDEWLLARRLTATRCHAGTDDLERTRRLRARLLTLLEAQLAGELPESADVEAVNAAAAVPAQAPRLMLGSDGVELDVGRPRVIEILGVIARDAIDLLTGPQRELLRECADEACRGVYVDASPARTRRWCSSARCGNRARVAAHRARRATASGRDGP
ncbi:MAG: CGNR zinc finger domain-containing protein [Dermatophilaceae bacterium]